MFVGYVLMQVPSNMLITKVKPGMYMSAWMLVWGVVSGESLVPRGVKHVLIEQAALLSSRATAGSSCAGSSWESLKRQYVYRHFNKKIC